MNKRATNSYFPFFVVQNHLILHQKFQGSEIRAWKFGGVGGGGAGGGVGVLIFGPSFFWFHRESDKCAMIKLPRKKKLRLLI